VSFRDALHNREAMVAAAAAEAVALARAAAEVAGEVARMAQRDHRLDVPRRDTEDSFLAKEVLRTEVGWEASHAPGVQLLEEEEFGSIFIDESEDDDDGQCFQGVVAVRSARRAERRARRVKAAKKAAKSESVPTLVASSSRKKRLKGCRSPLGCFYKMTGSKLLTAKQEVEFSEGIQVSLTFKMINAFVKCSHNTRFSVMTSNETIHSLVIRTLVVVTKSTFSVFTYYSYLLVKLPC
jgi:hypothetical protein